MRNTITWASSLFLCLLCSSTLSIAQETTKTDRFVRHLQVMIGQNPDGQAETDARETAKEMLGNKSINYERYKKYGNSSSSSSKTRSYRSKENNNRSSSSINQKRKKEYSKKHKEVDEGFF